MKTVQWRPEPNALTMPPSYSVRQLDMKEGSKTGAPVRVTANGTFTLSGWEGAAVTSLTVSVEDFVGLSAFIRSGYAGRLVDVLDVRAA